MPGIIISPGELVSYEKRQARISHRVNVSEVMIEFDNGERRVVKISHLEGPDETNPVVAIPSDSLSDAHRATANRVMLIVMPLFEYRRIPRSVMAEVCKKLGRTRYTVHRMMNKWVATESLTAFAPPRRPGGKGKSRLDPRIDAIIDQAINERYLRKAGTKVPKLHKFIATVCVKAGLPIPSKKTVYARIDAVPEEKRVRKRRGYSEARSEFELLQGNYTDAKYPLHIVQIDHTSADLVVVSDDTRLPVGRPTITYAVDVYTGMCVGLFVSLNSPSADLVGACLYRCMMPKDEWLKSLGIDAEWPIWGILDILHTDNGKDFRSDSLALTTKELGIEHIFRPVGRANYGGHIESMIKKVVEKLHDLPGTTMSNVADRGDYDSEKHAAISVKGLERLLVTDMCLDFHKQPINGGLTPEEHLNAAVAAKNYVQDRFQRTPKSREERDKLRIQCMPARRVTVQQYGIQIDGFRYSAPVLRKWVNQSNPAQLDGKFIIRRDPADWSTLYFLDPNLNIYFPIGYSNPSNPRMSEALYREAYAAVKKAGTRPTAQNIVRYINEHTKILEEEIQKTEDAKKRRRRIEAGKMRPNDIAMPTKPSKDSTPSQVEPVSDDGIDETFDSEEF